MRLSNLCLMIGLLAALPGPAQSETKAKAKARTKIESKVSEIAPGLDSHDARQVDIALDKLAKSDRPDAVRAIAQRINNGLPPDLLVKAVDAIVAIGGKPAIKELMMLSNHRRVGVRVKVARGLVWLKAPQARRVLVAMLDDSSAAVRGTAAVSLGAMGAGPAMSDLIAAARRGLAEAAQVVGEQAGPKHIKALLNAIDEHTLELFSPTLALLVARRDLKQSQKMKIVARLGEMPSHLASKLLMEFVESLPARDPLRKAAAKVLNDKKSREDSNESEDER